MLMIVLFIILKPDSWSLWDIRSWYFGDGLWDMPSSLLWEALLFETPFVILKVAPLLILLLLVVLYGYWALKARNLYKTSSVDMRNK